VLARLHESMFSCGPSAFRHWRTTGCSLHRAHVASGRMLKMRVLAVEQACTRPRVMALLSTRLEGTAPRGLCSTGTRRSRIGVAYGAIASPGCCSATSPARENLGSGSGSGLGSLIWLLQRYRTCIQGVRVGVEVRVDVRVIDLADAAPPRLLAHSACTEAGSTPSSSLMKQFRGSTLPDSCSGTSPFRDLTLLSLRMHH